MTISYEGYLADLKIFETTRRARDYLRMGLVPFNNFGALDIYYDHWLAHYPNQIVLHIKFKHHPYLNATFRVDSSNHKTRATFLEESGLGEQIINYYRYRPLVEREDNIELGEN